MSSNEQLKLTLGRHNLHEIARLNGIVDQWNNIGKRYNGGSTTQDLDNNEEEKSGEDK